MLCWELSCDSPRCGWQADHTHPLGAASKVRALLQNPDLQRGTCFQKAGNSSFPPCSLVAPGAQKGEMPQKHYFQSISRGPENLGFQTSEPGLPLPSSLTPPTPTCPYQLPPLLTNICSAVGHNPGLAVAVESGGGGHTHRTHSAWDRSATILV